MIIGFDKHLQEQHLKVLQDVHWDNSQVLPKHIHLNLLYSKMFLTLMIWNGTFATKLHDNYYNPALYQSQSKCKSITQLHNYVNFGKSQIQNETIIKKHDDITLL